MYDWSYGKPSHRNQSIEKVAINMDLIAGIGAYHGWSLTNNTFQWIWVSTYMAILLSLTRTYFDTTHSIKSIQKTPIGSKDRISVIQAIHHTQAIRWWSRTNFSKERSPNTATKLMTLLIHPFKKLPSTPFFLFSSLQSIALLILKFLQAVWPSSVNKIWDFPNAISNASCTSHILFALTFQLRNAFSC